VPCTPSQHGKPAAWPTCTRSSVPLVLTLQSILVFPIENDENGTETCHKRLVAVVFNRNCFYHGIQSFHAVLTGYSIQAGSGHCYQVAATQGQSQQQTAIRRRGSSMRQRSHAQSYRRESRTPNASRRSAILLILFYFSGCLLLFLKARICFPTYQTLSILKQASTNNVGQPTVSAWPCTSQSRFASVKQTVDSIGVLSALRSAFEARVWCCQSHRKQAW